MNPFDRLLSHVPSPLLEFIVGILFVGMLFSAGLHHVLFIATVASLFYELRVDKQGWNLSDFVWRQLGIILGVL